MPTRAELATARNAGPTTAEITENRRVLYERVLVTADTALSAAATAVTTVEGAANLAAAQAAVVGLGATVSSARNDIDAVLP